MADLYIVLIVQLVSNSAAAIMAYEFGAAKTKYDIRQAEDARKEARAERRRLKKQGVDYEEA